MAQDCTKGVTEVAPKGLVYECLACGRRAMRLIDFKDVSCALNAALVHDLDPREDENGPVARTGS